MVARETQFANFLYNYQKCNKLKKEFEEAKSIVSYIKYPRWIIEAWLRLYQAFQYNDFSTEDAENRLKKIGIRMILSELKKYNLLATHKDSKDARKTLYQLIDS